MNSKFGFKDLVNTVLLVTLIVSVWFAMKLVDRQHDALQNLAESQAAQDDTLRQIRDLLANGVAVRPDGPTHGDPPPAMAEAFPRLAAARAKPDFACGDWFIDVFANQVSRLTPLIQTDAYQSVIEGYVLESLLVRDPETLEWRGRLAESWELAIDGLSIRFTLRPDAVFSDGTPVTVDDVVFTYRMIMNPQINCPPLRTYYENIADVRAEGERDVVFVLDEPYFRTIDFTGGMVVLSKKFYERFTPEEFNEKPGLLFGSGPYRLDVSPESWEPGKDQVVLVRNENYWGPRPSFDRLVFRIVTDQNAQLVGLRNGEIDRYGVRPEQYEKLKADASLNAKANLYEYAYPNAGYRYIGWNQRRDGKPTLFADRRVRRAMTMLTDRAEMADQLMAGLATVATGPFNPLGQQADPAIKPIPYDLAGAVKLLKEAGFEDRDGDGVIESADGKPFEFKLTYPAGSPNYKQMAYYLKDAYARAGIKLNPESLEWNTMLQRIDERDFDAMTLGWTGSIEGDPKQIFHSGSIADGGSNYIGYANPELDELIDAARINLDTESRLAQWRRAHRILNDDQPYTFLFFQKAVVFVDKRIHNVLITRTGMNDRTEMYVPKALQVWTD